ncbi:helix-turn-helix domain-containing protein [uncultured Hymenobacter sp.]|uniref:helix-turn-helix domain-containing protein n=1 Tax=uncultured Hymenobacter sp. TaxID=170016 RepID=UPI0035CB1080
MPQTQSLEEFYRAKMQWMPENLRQDLGHFNVFRLDDFVGPQAQPVPYSRKDFYKISLMEGRNRYHYADKVVTIEHHALLFANPLVPYHWEQLDGPQTGFFCIFTPAFLHQHTAGQLGSFPVFQPGGQPIYILTDAQRANVRQLFEKMLVEIGSDYVHKYDLLRAYVLELIHSTQKLEPAITLYRTGNAAIRIASLFTELLARQFPIESPEHRVRLRSAQAFAGQLAVHVNHLNRALKEVTGKTTTQLLAERLVQEGQALLQHTDWPVAHIGYCLGFEEPAHFTHFFRKHTGQVPSAARIV